MLWPLVSISTSWKGSASNADQSAGLGRVRHQMHAGIEACHLTPHT